MAKQLRTVLTKMFIDKSPTWIAKHFEMSIDEATGVCILLLEDLLSGKKTHKNNGLPGNLRILDEDIIRAMEEADNVKAWAARLLGCSRETVVRRWKVITGKKEL